MASYLKIQEILKLLIVFFGCRRSKAYELGEIIMYKQATFSYIWIFWYWSGINRYRPTQCNIGTAPVPSDTTRIPANTTCPLYWLVFLYRPCIGQYHFVSVVTDLILAITVNIRKIQN